MPCGAAGGSGRVGFTSPGLRGPPGRGSPLAARARCGPTAQAGWPCCEAVRGWYAKFEIFRVLTDGGSGAGVSLAIIAAVNSVFAAFYYLAILKQMWFMPAPDGDHSRISIPPSLQAALGVTVFVTIVTGSVLIGPLSDITKLADLALP